jgi:hypothetical protein
MQFEMCKKGKNFGITERRLLRIEDGLIYQAGKDQDKPLPLPRTLTINRKIDDDSEWAES